MTRPNDLHGASVILVLGAFAAFAAANLLHNRWGLDVAIVPAAIFVALSLWRRRRAWLFPAALLILLPSFAFLKLSELISPTDVFSFLNHVALMLAGFLGVVTVIVALAARRRASQS